MCDTCAFIHLETVTLKYWDQIKTKIAGWGPIIINILLLVLVEKSLPQAWKQNIFIKIDVFPLNTCLRYGKTVCVWYTCAFIHPEPYITRLVLLSGAVSKGKSLKSQETTIILKILWNLVEIAIIITVIHNKFEILWSIKKRFDRDKILVIFFIILKYCENIENIVNYCEILWFVIGGCRYNQLIGRQFYVPLN